MVKVLKLRRLQKVGTAHRIDTFDETVMDDVSNQGRMIAEMDQDADVVLKDDKEVADAVKDVQDDEDETEPAEVQEVVEVVTTAKLIYEVTTTSDLITASTIDHVKKKAKEDHAVKKYQVLKRKPQTEGKARKNMIVYLKNVAGFKMDYFKGMSYDDIRPIFEAKFNSNVAFLQKTREEIEEEENRALKRINETLAKKQLKDKNLEESEKCTWSNKGQGMEAIGIMWCIDHNFYNYPADFVSGEEVPTHKIHSRLDAECYKTLSRGGE
nr:hypothetical protein [Tanacetum cinerariifolium]